MCGAKRNAADTQTGGLRPPLAAREWEARASHSSHVASRPGGFERVAGEPLRQRRVDALQDFLQPQTGDVQTPLDGAGRDGELLRDLLEAPAPQVERLQRLPIQRLEQRQPRLELLDRLADGEVLL